MPVRKTRRQFTVEALERRETPSGGLSGGVHAMVRHPKPIAFHATAVVALTSQTSATITNGQSNVLGAFSGNVAAGGASLTGTNGTLDLSFNGAPGRPHNGKEAFHGSFKILSGSINGINVTGGQGTVTGTLIVSTESGNVTINGKITE
ncbi:MAG: hypothetical protein P4L84_02835 [Isosphaeraceae bacterium]|nr:hypothetical protein [Isosphaeraceae bacterium]